MVGKEQIRHTPSYLVLVAAVLLGALLLLVPALYNGYPLVNPDTATYLASGFKPETPFDRPITYGLLIRLFSLNGTSLWLVVYVQAVLVSSLIIGILKRLMPGGTYLLKGLFTLLFLSLCTSLSWVVCQVQPDIFTPIAILCIVLLLMGPESKTVKVSLYLIFFISVAVHLSHPLLLACVVGVLWLVRRLYMPINSQIGRIATTLVVLCAASMLVMGSAFSKSRHVYFMGSLLQKGVLHVYLQDSCAANNMKICAYKDVLGNSSDHFVWDGDSPLYKIGDWKGTKTEFNKIIRDVLTTPKYLWLFVTASMRETMSQAITFRIGDGNDCFAEETNVGQRIREYLPQEAAIFYGARQNKTDIRAAIDLPNKVFAIVVMVCVVVCGYGLLKWKLLPQQVKILLWVCTIGIVMNCLDCATLSVVNGRYGSKMIWLLPLCAVAITMTRGTIKPPQQTK